MGARLFVNPVGCLFCRRESGTYEITIAAAVWCAQAGKRSINKGLPKPG